MSGRETITSTRNPRVQAATRLRDGRHRRREGLFLIDGQAELRRAVDADIELVEVFACEAMLEPAQSAWLAEAALQRGAALFDCARPVYEKLAYGQGRSGMVAVARVPDTTLARLRPVGCSLVAVLEGIEKPGNVGAVARSADATGVTAMIVADGVTDLFNPNAIRASLGTLFAIPLAEATAVEARAWLVEQDLQIVTATVDASREYSEVDFTRPTAMVLGSEAHGLSATWRDTEVVAARLPMLGSADSLNLSVTAAVMFYEALRQRRQADGPGR